MPSLQQIAALAVELVHAQAREDFALFRRLKRPDMLWGWWTDEVARELQQFYRDMIAGKRPWLVLEAPPQVGKSWTAWDFIAWISGKHPGWKTIFASYSDELGVACNADVQRTLKSETFRAIFPEVRIDEPGWKCSETLIEFVGTGGSFRNTTIERAVNGFGLDLGVIDDPIKGRNEANSKTTRNSTWSWLVDDFLARFANKAGLLIVMTRWHVDDPVGRLIEKFGNGVRVLRYPAIAEQDEVHLMRRGYGYERVIRSKGEALFPEHKPLDFLLQRKKAMSQASWEAEYQQNPIISGGGILPIAKLGTIDPWTPSKQVLASVRYWDKACGCKGTLVTTARGEVAIEQVKVGDAVLTRRGFRPVRRAWLTKLVNSIASVVFTDGSYFDGTADHQFFVKPGHWVALGDLRGSDIVLHRSEVWQDRAIPLWKNDFLMAAVIPATRGRGRAASGAISIATSGTAAPDAIAIAPCTATSGKPLTGLSPRALIFTTRTKTGTTTRCRILSASQPGSTISGIVEPQSFAALCDAGTRSTVLACKRRHDKLFAESISIRDALAADVDFGHEIEASEFAGGVPVYDLEVADQHEFFANGVLVHNCTPNDPGASFTAGVLMHKLKDGRYVIEHIVHGQWSALDREQIIKDQTERDAKLCPNYQVWVEQEPGSGGKESAENTIRNLSGYRVYADKVTGSKDTRAEPFAAQVQGGNVWLVADFWVNGFKDEAEVWPHGKRRDQIDAAAGAFAKLVKATGYNHNFSEWAL